MKHYKVLCCMFLLTFWPWPYTEQNRCLPLTNEINVLVTLLCMVCGRKKVF